MMAENDVFIYRLVLFQSLSWVCIRVCEIVMGGGVIGVERGGGGRGEVKYRYVGRRELAVQGGQTSSTF